MDRIVRRNSTGEPGHPGVTRHRRVGSALAVLTLVAWSALTLPGITNGQQPSPLPPGDLGEGESLPVIPPDENVPPFGPDQTRFSRLAEGLEPSVPAPTPELLAEYARYVQLGEGPGTTLDMIIGRPRVLKLVRTPRRLQIADERVAEYALLSPQEVSLLGLRVGSTVLNLWFPDENNPNELKMLSFLVRIMPDPEVRNRLERAYRALEEEINRTFADSKIKILLLGDKVAVTGQAKDMVEANMIMRAIQANVLPLPDVGGATTDLRLIRDDARPIPPRIPTGFPQVINMMRVPGEQQVMLQVTVAEVDRAAARTIGLNFNIFNNNGLLVAGQNTGRIAMSAFNTGLGAFAPFVAGNNPGARLTGLGGVANLPVALDNGQIPLAINALKNLSYARFLAEPTLTTMNGHPATFQAGGQFPIPIVTGGIGGINAFQGVAFIPVGVQLSFTPYITDRDRIRLVLSAAVSERDQQQPPTIIDGAAVPSLTTRNFSSVVELREGQTLAVAGLIQNRLDTDASRVPWLGGIPILGRAFSFDQTAARETEIVVLVTPQLVHPMDATKLPPLPGADIHEPNDLEFYLLGRLESHKGIDYRSPIRTDLSRIKQYRQMELTYLAGPHGPSFDLPFASPVVEGAPINPDGVIVDGPYPAMPPPPAPHPQPGNGPPMTPMPNYGPSPIPYTPQPVVPGSEGLPSPGTLPPNLPSTSAVPQAGQPNVYGPSNRIFAMTSQPGSGSHAATNVNSSMDSPSWSGGSR